MDHRTHKQGNTVWPLGQKRTPVRIYPHNDLGHMTPSSTLQWLVILINTVLNVNHASKLIFFFSKIEDEAKPTEKKKKKFSVK